MSNVDTLIKRQIALNEQITKAASNHKKAGKARRTLGYFKARITFLDGLWQQFCTNHRKISENPPAADSTYLTADVYQATEEIYFEFLADLNEGLEGCKGFTYENPNTSNTTTQSIPKISLPPIAIPKFDGNYKTWRSFHDLFTSLIDSNDTLSKVQKLHYLKTNVSGEAERLVRQFDVIESNYDKAWELLTKRYNNKRALVNHQLQRLLNQPQIRAETSTTIKTFLDQTEECIHELQALELPVEEWDAILLHILVQKLPSETHYYWEQDIRNHTKLPTYSEFTAFLETRFRTLEALNDGKKTITPKPTYGLLNKGPTTNKQKTPNTTSLTCIHCRKPHILYHCPTFRTLTTQQRHEFATNKHLCKNCLSPNHTTLNCPSNKKCNRCNRKHNTLLHYESTPTTSAIKPTTNSNTDSNMSSTHTHNPERQQVQNFLTSNVKRALLATALVNITTPSGISQTFRAIIDSGSQVSIMTERAYKRLQLKGSPTNHELIGLGKTRTNSVQLQTKVTLSSLYTKFRTKVNMLIIHKITDLLPTETIRASDWKHIHNLQLADPTFTIPGEIDLLLGADIYSQILTDGIVKGATNTPIAQNTELGWILMGNIPSTNNFHISIIATHTTVSHNLEDQLKHFWELEECPTSPTHSPEDQLCEKIYEDTTTRLSNGKYQVYLPFKTPPQFGQSRNMAVQQFLQLERRLDKNAELYDLYRTCINEYTQLGHMKPISATQVHAEARICNNFPFYYLPHHAVLKESTTTKLRVVFNASAKTSNGRSLNEQLMIGPTIQPTLWTTLLRWRLYKYAFTADIEKMYRMIQMAPEHQNYQRIIWRNNSTEELQDYALTTVTFGTAPAPFLAIKTLQQLAKDEALKYPLAAKSIMRDFYVDDLVTGAHNLDEALSLQQQLIAALKQGAFNLRKWTANHPKLLQNIHIDYRELKTSLEFAESESIKTLGIQWYPTTDHFSFKVKLPNPTTSYTKRIILSEVSTLFDPLGWLAPCIVKAKILIQKLWLIKSDWDDKVPDEVANEWITFKTQLPTLQTINIPRWLKFEPELRNIEIHGFCDASNNAYAAVLYLKITNSDNITHVRLITAKTKVAPIKLVSLPRLELSGALLLSKLIKQVSTDLELSKGRVIAWTDSNIVLAWIQKHPSTWKTFVGNRVAEIHENMPQAIWRHVPSKQNPADVASRGIGPNMLPTLSTWWNGPDWLHEDEEFWPSQPSNTQTELEQRKIKVLTNTMEQQISLLDKFSSFQKTVRITAYCLRFIKILRKQRSSTTWLLLSELENAETCLIRMLQHSVFSAEITCLQNQHPIPRKSRLLSLNPILDSNQVLRVGGRLSESLLTYDQKHPIILPNNHHITHILIDYTHQYTLHGGTQIILSMLRNKYWLLNARNTIRHRIHKCMTCFRFNAKPASQLMSSLPSARVNMSLPFQHTGVDYAGPIEIKTSPIRNAKITKAYICLFVCLATKAIHLELVSDLTTPAFLAALKRFIARRGLCTHIYSDRGTNFVGAHRVLQKNLESAITGMESSLAGEMANQGITWHFNPPAAPHFGGLWEAGVKSTKRHLYKTIKNATLTYEELNTTLIQIEACLNARPLIPLSNDPTDYNFLTPGHFLTGRHNLTTIEPPPLDHLQHPLKRWQYMQWLAHNFWKKWTKDYLHTLQQRNKWHTEKTNIKTGTLVLIKDDQIPLNCWPVGRILEVHTGHNNLVRAVTIKTAKGTLTRPITKICPLPLYQDSQ